MADTCIVCLGDLASGEDDTPAAKDPWTSAPQPQKLLEARSTLQHKQYTQKNSSDENPSPNKYPLDNPDLIAHLLPCGHDLHNECLKPWVERANSCPMCRQSFNLVELKTSKKGSCFSSYVVQDKRQVADLDPSMIIEDDVFDQVSSVPCLICEHYGDEELLLLCDGCCASCHTYCAGLDGVPAGPWFCQFCLNDFPISPSARTRSGRTLRTRGQQRRLGRVDQSSDAWARVWQSVWDNLNIDLDFPFNEEPEVNSRTQAQRREFNEWQQRFRIAESHGAGAAARFRDTAATLLEGRQPPGRGSSPLPESQEEIRAWNAFDKAREIASHTTNTNQTRSKRRSAPNSPAEPKTEQERPLKRPRTRRLQQQQQQQQDTSNESLFHPQSSSSTHPPDQPTAISPTSASRNRSFPDGETAGPGFFQSLLNEVQTKPSVPEASNSLQALPPIFTVPATVDQISPNSSSPGTPTGSNHPSPLVRTASPPPFRSSRPASPPLTSRIEPVFAAAVQPHLPPQSSPSRSASDSEESNALVPRSARQKSNWSKPSSKAQTASSPSQGSASLAQIRSMKAEVQQMVSAALKPAYHKQEIDSDEFTGINRDISRMLYDKVGAAGGLKNESEKEKWQTLATNEVEAAVNAVKKLKENSNDVQALVA